MEIDKSGLEFELGEIIRVNKEQRKVAGAETRRCIDFNVEKINNILNSL
jgi:hypothetical protein